MTLLEACLLGIIQGLFMFIPVSSTSHLVLTQHLLIARGSDMPAPESAEMILFDLVVHVGTLVSMAVVFRPSIVGYLRRLRGELVGGRADGRAGDRVALRLGLMALLAVFVTGAIGFPLRSLFGEVFARPILVAAMLVVTGAVLWWTDVLSPRRRGLRKVGPGVAVIVGTAQGLALLPGLSRSGTTIAAGLFTGLRRRWAAEFSFMIAFPTILGATLLQGAEVLRDGVPGEIGVSAYLVGATTAALVGIGSLHLVLTLLYRARFRYFSWYVWALAAAVLVAGAAGFPIH